VRIHRKPRDAATRQGGRLQACGLSAIRKNMRCVDSAKRRFGCCRVPATAVIPDGRVAGMRQYRPVRNPSETKRRGFRVAAFARLRIVRKRDPHPSHRRHCTAFKRFTCVDPGAPSAVSASTMVAPCKLHPVFLQATRISLRPSARSHIDGIESDPSRISRERTTLSSIGETSALKEMLGDREMNGAMVIERGFGGDPRREGPCCG